MSVKVLVVFQILCMLGLAYWMSRRMLIPDTSTNNIEPHPGQINIPKRNAKIIPVEVPTSKKNVHISKKKLDVKIDPPRKKLTPKKNGVIPNSIVLSGVAKNIPAWYIRAHIPKLIRLGEEAFSAFHIVIYENDSPDDAQEAFRSELAKT
eukprot:969450_1